MAIRNFVKNGTYSRIETFSYSKHSRQASANFVVYEDETLERKLLSNQYHIDCSCAAVETGKIIEANELLDVMLPDYGPLKNGDTRLIMIPEGDPSLENDFIAQVNTRVVTRSNGQLLYLEPLYVLAEGVLYKRKANGKLRVCKDVETAQQFDVIFSNNSLLNDMYKIIKNRPEFSGCIDEE